jgi:hypothetical protein
MFNIFFFDLYYINNIILAVNKYNYYICLMFKILFKLAFNLYFYIYLSFNLLCIVNTNESLVEIFNKKDS